MNNLRNFTIVLGSKSPRRKEILELGGYKFITKLKEIEEILPNKISTYKAAEYLSKLKSEAYTVNQNELLITSDTTVVLDNEILGKPKNKKEAFIMLKSLRGRAHQVISGVTIKTNHKSFSFSEITNVYFKEFHDDDIDFYIDNYKPFDKAGSYGIQEWIGVNFIEKIEGCYYNVMGLPLSRINDEIKKIPAC